MNMNNTGVMQNNNIINNIKTISIEYTQSNTVRLMQECWIDLDSCSLSSDTSFYKRFRFWFSLLCNIITSVMQQNESRPSDPYL